MSEWLLLVESEAIRIGDTIEVETEDGETVLMRLVKYTAKTVTLKNEYKELIRFHADSLEAKYGSEVIIGKA
jgi:hypothetical protein